MNFTNIFWIFWIFSLITDALQLMFPAAAESPQDLKCDVIQQPNGFKYQLSKPPSSSLCTTCWEDENKTVIARDSSLDPQLVQNLTNQFVILKACRDYLHYKEDCPGNFEEVDCRVNCSLFLDTDLHPPTVNSTQTCIFRTWCPDPLTVWLIAGFVVCLFLLALGCFLCKRRRESAAARSLYISATQQVVMEMSEQKGNSV